MRKMFPFDDVIMVFFVYMHFTLIERHVNRSVIGINNFIQQLLYFLIVQYKNKYYITTIQYKMVIFHY